MYRYYLPIPVVHKISNYSVILTILYYFVRFIIFNYTFREVYSKCFVENNSTIIIKIEINNIILKYNNNIVYIIFK